MVDVLFEEEVQVAMHSSQEDPEEVGPVKKLVREKVKELESIRELLGKARQERAAGRIEELHTDIARRLGEIERLLND